MVGGSIPSRPTILESVLELFEDWDELYRHTLSEPEIVLLFIEFPELRGSVMATTWRLTDVTNCDGRDITG